MDYLWQVHYDYDWGGFVSLVIQLALLYALIKVAERIMLRLISPANWQSRLKEFTKVALLVFEPLSALLILSYLIMIKPFFHGLIVILILLIGLRHLRNYISGRILLFDPGLRNGIRLNHQSQNGLITSVGRLGLQLQTSKGLHFINYEDLLSHGYTVLTRKESGTFFRLKVKANLESENTPNKQNLAELLQVIPYLNWNYTARLQHNQDDDKEWIVDLAVHDENHLNDLIQRLAEQNFLARITKI